MQSISCHDPCEQTSHGANTLSPWQIGQGRKPKKFSSRREIVTIFLPSYTYSDSSSKGGFLIARPRLLLNARIGTGYTRVLFSVTSGSLYIQTRLYIYVNSSACSLPLRFRSSPRSIASYVPA